ncbi:DUF2188 domain-containing protein [Sinorhizobium terangae]|uniref:DUF2188 domain-containing protein n=1 Tax=Sinorhizobium terangae TaxID=110322 RepID=UPI0024B26E2A|nr:DUF2188 domain-containing protein [Sinorhizobium terangae]WFU49869.1 DUF2188 domain-containing protein [Sinorhizobium terangae]
MAKLPKFMLTHNDTKDRWDLTKDGARRPTTTFATKAEATKGGALEKAVGKAGGSVKIQKVAPFIKIGKRFYTRSTS